MKSKFLIVLLSMLLASCNAKPSVGTFSSRRGDEIVVCGQFFHTGAPVVTWLDPGGYDAYRVEKRFAPWDKSQWTNETKSSTTPNRYGVRFAEAARGPAGSGDRLDDETLERVRGGGWDLPSLQRAVDQFVIHYDVCGSSRECFRVLHDVRGLSVHFLLDVDGTIYQTLDLKERAWHATTSNDRSIGIEIAHIGAYPPVTAVASETANDDIRLPPILKKWYGVDEPNVDQPAESRLIRVKFPYSLGDAGVRTSNFIPRPATNHLVTGVIQGATLVQYDFTNEQYDSLVKLTAALCTIFPNLDCDYPKDRDGNLITDKLSDDDLIRFRGLLGHYHIQSNKTDPGPAFNWKRVVNNARRLMRR